MASFAANLAAKHFLKQLSNKEIDQNKADPYYEYVTTTGTFGRGKKEKKERGMHPNINPHDAQILRDVRYRAHRLDLALFSILGVRFGWSAVIGLIPVIGDAIDLLLAFRLVRKCGKIEGGLPFWGVQFGMYMRILFDFILGFVPFLGDLADAGYRANTRNVWKLEEYLVSQIVEESEDPERHAAASELKSTPARPAEARVADHRSARVQDVPPRTLTGSGRVQPDRMNTTGSRR